MDIPEKLKAKTVPADKVVLLLAAIKKNSTLNADYKLMAALSGGQYTHSALEHQFRDFNKAAQELLTKNPDTTGKDAPPLPPRKRKAKDANAGESASGENEEVAKPRAAKAPRTTKKQAAKVKEGPEDAEDEDWN